MKELLNKFEERADKFLSRFLIDPLNKLMDKFEELGKERFPAKFEFRYNKIKEEFLTVPVSEIGVWDKEYGKALKKAKMKA